MLPSLGQCKPIAVRIVREWASALVTCIINQVCWGVVCGPCTAWWIRVDLASRVTWSARCALDETNSKYSLNAVIVLGSRKRMLVLCQKYYSRFLSISLHRACRVDQSCWNFHRWLVKNVPWFQLYSYQLPKVYNSFKVWCLFPLKSLIQSTFILSTPVKIGKVQVPHNDI